MLHFDVLLVKKDIIALAREQGLGLRSATIYRPKCPTLADDIHGNAQAQKDSRLGELEWQKNCTKVAAILSLNE